MTNHWIDLKNSDVVLIMGSNAAENHPISFKWVMKAKEAGGKIIHVDPRFTRTSTKADIYAPLRSGTDIAFLGGMIKYILDNNLYQKDYVLNYTNASFIVGKDFAFKDGLFAGFNPETNKYDKTKWAFEAEEGLVKKDATLQNERCVYQLLKNHYARYDMKTVSDVTGTPLADLERVYKAYTETGVPTKAGTIMYAMGWTQHTVGVQNIRTMAMIQLLLGNMGVAGGGVNALRGESNVQGSTDQGLLNHIYPGYLPTPTAAVVSLEEYNKRFTPKTAEPMSANWWGNRPKYIASFLTAMYPGMATADSYNYLPKRDDGKDYSWLSLFDAMHKGQIKGFFSWGQNPAASGANSNKTREALAKLDWLVNVNIFENETGSFWRGPGMDPKKIKTEVFFLPCAVSIEKEGSISNSGRLMQWRYAGPKPMGSTLPDGDMIYDIFLKVRALYDKDKKAPMREPILALNWDFGNGHGFDPHKVAKTINGYYTKDGKIKVGDAEIEHKKGQQVATFAHLQTDGTTACGNWIYTASYTDKGNMAARRDKNQTPMQENIGLFPNWAWAWPVNRRVLYNRASVDINGQPLNPKKAVIAWDPEKKAWVGDVPDGPWPPMADKEKGRNPFIMTKDGFGQIYGPGLNDGPFPEHYEAMECPIEKHPFSPVLNNPTALTFVGEKYAVCDPRYPFVCTTYRVTEHWQTGLMTRYTPWLLEAEPQMFVEMGEELAELRGIKNGDRCMLNNERGEMWAVAIVTKRIRPFTIMGQTVHMVGIPWHYGWVFPKDGGDSANILTPSVGDPNTGIPESKAFMVNVRKA
jgi:formate dehydrogenase major subunit